MILFYAYIVYSLQDIYSPSHTSVFTHLENDLWKKFFLNGLSHPRPSWTDVKMTGSHRQERTTKRKKERKKRIAIATSRFNDPIYTQYVHQVLQSLRTCWAIDFQWSAVTVADIIIFKHSRAYRGACDPGSWVRSYIHPPRVPSLFLRTLPSHTWN